MVEDQYDREHCTSCDFFIPRSDGGEPDDTCTHKETDPRHWPDRHDYCDLFRPSLECRMVLGIEALATGLVSCLRDDGSGGSIFDVTTR